jgi:hypothetical protein
MQHGCHCDSVCAPILPHVELRHRGLAPRRRELRIVGALDQRPVGIHVAVDGFHRLKVGALLCAAVGEKVRVHHE